MMEQTAGSERYHRQVILKELGDAGQQKLLGSRVLVVGAGGLGCPVLQYLAAAGIGTIGVLDHDTVSVSNLHRQVLYTAADVGSPKVLRARIKLRELNPDVEVIPYPCRLTTENALEILAGFDVVVDATDNFPTRYLISDACVLLKKPLVQGAVSRFEGQLAVFNCQGDPGERPVSYRDLFPDLPRDGEVANCAEAGVLGVLPAIIGSMQAAEVIKLLTGIGRPLAGRLQTFNMLTSEWYTWDISIHAGAEARMPKNEQEFLQTYYGADCSTAGYGEIDAATFETLRSQKQVIVLDVRETGEEPLIDEFQHLQVPLAALTGHLHELESEVIVTVCQSGKRSREAALLLAEAFPARTIYSLRDGIVSWKQQFRPL